MSQDRQQTRLCSPRPPATRHDTLVCGAQQTIDRFYLRLTDASEHTPSIRVKSTMK